MIGLDTSILIAADVTDHPLNQQIKAGLNHCLREGEILAIAPQVFHEYLHVVTDSKRFHSPLPMSDALDRVRFWREAKEVRIVFPSEKSLQQQEGWMRQFHLGRKRILDTALAAVYHDAGVSQLATTNPSDFALFNVFTFEAWAH